MQRDNLETLVESTKDSRDNVVSGNEPSLGTLSPKTAYSKNVTIEEWNQAVANLTAALQNAAKDRDLATALSDAVLGLLDVYADYSVVKGDSRYVSVTRSVEEDSSGSHVTFTVDFDDSAIDDPISDFRDGTDMVRRAYSDEDGLRFKTGYAKLGSANEFTQLVTFSGDVAFPSGNVMFVKYDSPAFVRDGPIGKTAFMPPLEQGSAQLTLITREFVVGAFNDIIEGATVVGRAAVAAADSESNVIHQTYETKSDAAAKVTRSNLVSILGEASSSLNGLMSATDKSRLDVLYALLDDSDSDTVVDTIQEVLSIFAQYPEGATLVNQLAAKVGFADVVNSLNSDEISKPLSAYQGKVLNGRLTEVEENYVDHDDVFSAAMFTVSDYDESTGEVTLEYSASAITNISYSSSTGEVTFTY